MSVFSRIILGFAVFILLAHNSVAHSHAPIYEASVCTEDSNKGFLHLLQHFFSVDQGSDHLQHFQPEGKIKIRCYDCVDLYSFTLAQLSIYRPNRHLDIIFPDNTSNASPEYFASDNPHRGPPVG
ncbi:MAG TPA: hypothetical protein DDY13_14035 [Cytophagales bacterium]|jgi:hypothetical protein|nr:hypothetical protein [Cytophagales bacterium]